MASDKARVPPRWFAVIFWHVHRRIVRASRGRKGLWPARPGKWGALRLTTTGRRSGEPRSVILGYYEDGPNLVSMAMNGWGAAEPAQQRVRSHRLDAGRHPLVRGVPAVHTLHRDVARAPDGDADRQQRAAHRRVVFAHRLGRLPMGDEAL